MPSVRLTATVDVADAERVPTEVTWAYSLALLGLLIAIGTVVFMASRKGGRPVNMQTWRLWVGVACLGAAAVVGVVGYLQLSEEPLVNHQLPYLASAGMAVVVLSVLGGSLIVAEQVRADERKISELEEAVEALASAVGPAIEAPARRSGPGAAADSV